MTDQEWQELLGNDKANDAFQVSCNNPALIAIQGKLSKAMGEHIGKVMFGDLTAQVPPSVIYASSPMTQLNVNWIDDTVEPDVVISNG